MREKKGREPEGNGICRWKNGQGQAEKKIMLNGKTRKDRRKLKRKGRTNREGTQRAEKGKKIVQNSMVWEEGIFGTRAGKGGAKENKEG